MKPVHSLLNPWFIGGLLALILNDAWLKAAFPGVLSGKLSDVAGLLVFPLFWTAFFPRFRPLIYLLTGLLFLVWKTPLADGFISFFNTWSPLPIGRTVDYTDWLALIVLPVGYRWLRLSPGVYDMSLRPVLSGLVAVVAMGAFCATSMVPVYRQLVTGDTHKELFLHGDYELRMTESEIVQQLDALGYRWRTDSVVTPSWSNEPLHHLSVFRLGYAGDTLARVRIHITSVNEKMSLLSLSAASLPEGTDSLLWAEQVKLAKTYKTLIRKGLVRPLQRKNIRTTQ